MTRIVAVLGILLSGCAVVTTYPYKPIATDGVVKRERCSTHYSYRSQIDEGIVLTIDTANSNYNYMFVSIGVEIAGANSFRLLDNKIRLQSGDDNSFEYGEVTFYTAVSSIKGRAIPRQKLELLTGTATTDEERQIANAFGHVPYKAYVRFGRYFPKRFTLHLPEIQTTRKMIVFPPLSYEMQTEQSVSGVLCGL